MLFIANIQKECIGDIYIIVKDILEYVLSWEEIGDFLDADDFRKFIRSISVTSRASRSNLG